MNSITVHMPESLVRGLTEAAHSEGITLDQFLSSAAAEKLSAWRTLDHLRQRAEAARREDFLRFLSNSPEAPPLPGDE